MIFTGLRLNIILLLVQFVNLNHFAINKKQFCVFFYKLFLLNKLLDIF